MASSQEIRSQIASIQNTQKITKAMEMVAASKMKKAQDQMTRARPYAGYLMLLRILLKPILNIHLSFLIKEKLKKRDT